MKKLLSLFTVLIAALVLVACGGGKYEIALITDKGNIDDKSFNQGSWEGVLEFVQNNKDKREEGKTKDYTHKYYRPEEATDEGYLTTIRLAVKNGAKVIVTPGFLFEVAVYEAQTEFPDVKFILLDGAPRTADYSKYETKANVASVMYAEEQSGFLAGYAAVKDGFTKLGFMGGMAVPAVQAFGYGYLQGIEYAAKELDLANPVAVNYHYTGNFEENSTNKGTANTMYQGGTEVIFASGGSVGKSVMAAAKERGKKVIGVDVDQRYDSETVITSATKGLAASVVQILEAIYNTNKWADFGAKTTYFNAENNGVGLPTVVIGDANGNAFDRFTSFNKAQYDAIFDKLVKNQITLLREISVADASGKATAAELTLGLSLTKVTVNVVGN